jgi:hypothetical protein
MLSGSYVTATWEPDTGSILRHLIYKEINMVEKPSIMVLRKAGGPLTTREVTKRTSVFMGTNCFYEDVHSVLATAWLDGEITRVRGANDFRDTLWEAKK